MLANIPVHGNQPIIHPHLLLLKGLFLSECTFLHVYASPLKFYEPSEYPLYIFQKTKGLSNQHSNHNTGTVTLS